MILAWLASSLSLVWSAGAPGSRAAWVLTIWIALGSLPRLSAQPEARPWGRAAWMLGAAFPSLALAAQLDLARSASLGELIALGPGVASIALLTYAAQRGGRIHAAGYGLLAVALPLALVVLFDQRLLATAISPIAWSLDRVGEPAPWQLRDAWPLLATLALVSLAEWDASRRRGIDVEGS